MGLKSNSIIICDEEGLLSMEGVQITDLEIGQEFYNNLELCKKFFYTSSIGNEAYVVHPFDEPLIGKAVVAQSRDKIYLKGPYQTYFLIDLNTLCLDEWDRVHGFAAKTKPLLVEGQENSESLEIVSQQSQLPFVLSRKAQEQLFELADQVQDDSLTLFGKEYQTPPYLQKIQVGGAVENQNFWNDIYLKEENPGWNLGAPSPAILDMTPRLKLPKSRILVLGSGEGHDAAFFAQEGGHLVTAVDFSPEAIQRSKSLYGHLDNLSFIQQDVFNLPPSMDHSFDVVVEHTCYCAIHPEKRSLLASVWSRMLAPRGFLMGVFFTMDKRTGPPFGSTEWEIRERLRKKFRFLYWNRWGKSIESRQNLETFVLAQKLT